MDDIAIEPTINRATIISLESVPPDSVLGLFVAPLLSNCASEGVALVEVAWGEIHHTLLVDLDFLRFAATAGQQADNAIDGLMLPESALRGTAPGWPIDWDEFSAADVRVEQVEGLCRMHVSGLTPS